MNNSRNKHLLEDYQKRKNKIKQRLRDFEKNLNGSEKDVFAELCFCLCTPQTKARTCDTFIRKVKENGLLFGGSEKEIRAYMKGVRFCDNKVRYIVEARRIFTENSSMRIKNIIKKYKPFELREWFLNNVKGLGMKESSHFLRNIGLGQDLAILDRHILKNLKFHGVIGEIPPCITKKRYLKIEDKMRSFSKEIGIPMAELDLLFWSRETGEIFK